SGLGSTMDSRPDGGTVTGVTVESGAREAECGCGRGRVGVPVSGVFLDATACTGSAGSVRGCTDRVRKSPSARRGSDVAPGFTALASSSRLAFSLACSMVMQVSDVVALHSKSLVVPAHPDSVRRLASVSATGTVLFICGSFTWGYCESAFGINWLWLSLPSWLSIWSVLNPFMPPCGTDGGGTGLRSSPSALLLSFS